MIKPPETLDEAQAWAAALNATGTLKGRTEGQILACILAGAELGLGPMESQRAYHVMQGALTPAAATVVALAKRHPDCEYFRLVSATETEAVYETRRVGDPHPTRLLYSIRDAERAGLTRSPTWKAHPRAMLCARCSAALARLAFPDGAWGDEGGEAPPPTPRIDAPPVGLVEAAAARREDAAEAAPFGAAEEASRKSAVAVLRALYEDAVAVRGRLDRAVDTAFGGEKNKATALVSFVAGTAAESPSVADALTPPRLIAHIADSCCVPCAGDDPREILRDASRAARDWLGYAPGTREGLAAAWLIACGIIKEETP